VSNIVLYSQIKGIIRGIFNPEYRLTQYNLLTNEIEAIEVLSRKGREVIKDYYRMNESMVEMSKTAHLTCLLGDSEKIDESTKALTNSSTINSRKKTHSHSASKSNKDQVGVKIDKCNLFNSY
jgi:hypothetical protein